MIHTYIYISLLINYDNGLVTEVLVADPFFSQLGQSPVLTFFLLQFPKQTINSVTICPLVGIGQMYCILSKLYFLAI